MRNLASDATKEKFVPSFWYKYFAPQSMFLGKGKLYLYFFTFYAVAAIAIVGSPGDGFFVGFWKQMSPELIAPEDMKPRKHYNASRHYFIESKYIFPVVKEYE
jgi:hypothetical protein